MDINDLIQTFRCKKLLKAALKHNKNNNNNDEYTIYDFSGFSDNTNV